MSEIEKFVFRKTSGDKKIKKVSIEKGERISKGGLFAPFGVHRAKVKIGKAEVPIVLKQYPSEKAHKPERISEIYQSMRADRLRVPTTFRFDAKRGMSIMSDLNHSGLVALSSKNHSDIIDFNTIQSFPDFQDVTKDLLEEALKASQLGYYIPSDSYFILVAQNPDIRSSFIIGDLDTVDRSENAEPTKAGYALLEAYSFLNYFIKTWITSESAPRLKEIVKAEYRSAQEKAVQMGLMDGIWEPIEIR